MALGIAYNLLRFTGEIVEVAGGDKGLLKKLSNTFNQGAFANKVRVDNSKYSRSIRGKADKYILQFPLVFSESIPMDIIDSVRNQLEIERAGEFLIELSNSPLQMYEVGDSEFLPSLHTNINIGESLSYNDILEINEDLLNTLHDKIEVSSLNERTLPKEFLMSISEDLYDYEEERGDEKVLDQHYFDNDKVDIVDDEDDNTYVTTKGSDRYEKVNFAKFPDKEKDSSTKILSDLKDLNRSTPIIISTPITYLIHGTDDRGNTYSSNDGDSITRTMVRDIRFGVKVVGHNVTSEDVVFYLADSAKRSNLLSNLVRFTSGEIKFVKDVLLQTDKAKHSAKNRKNGANIFTNLNTLSSTEKLKQYSSFTGISDRYSAAIPTTALVLTVEEVEMIYRKSGLNILNNRNAASKIYDDLFLLELLVVDEVNDILYKYMAKDKSFDRIKLSTMSGNRITDAKKKEMSSEDLLKILKRR